MDVLSSRVLLRPADPARSQAFYRDVLGLAVHREFGPPDSPGVVVIDRTVLEWRLDPKSEACIPEASSHDLEVVVVCRQGYSSSLAAASLRALGLPRATDLDGGVEAWLAAGLPVHGGPADVRE